jgi:hypothetical protein
MDSYCASNVAANAGRVAHTEQRVESRDIEHLIKLLSLFFYLMHYGIVFVPLFPL